VDPSGELYLIMLVCLDIDQFSHGKLLGVSGVRGT
jgi:hypothetical protein